MSTVTVQGWGPRQNALCPKAALACPRSAHSKRPLWGDSHSPPSFITVMSFISAPSAMGQGALSTRPTGERGPRPSSTSTSALHCRPGRRGTSAGRATKKAGVKLVRLESEACPPSGQAAWHVCPREEEEGVALGPSREGSSPGGTGSRSGRQLPGLGACGPEACAGLGRAVLTARLTSRLLSICASLSCNPATQDPFE